MLVAFLFGCGNAENGEVDKTEGETIAQTAEVAQTTEVVLELPDLSRTPDETFFTDDGFEIGLYNGHAVILGYGGENASIKIPNIANGYPVVAIGNEAFMDSHITQDDLPASIVIIGNYAFGGCEWLTEFEIPEGVTSIKDDTFCECKRLTKVTIPSSVTYIGSRAFKSCPDLTELELSDNVTFISNDAFLLSNPTIICNGDSYAAKYARGNNLKIK